uniref:Uncharacterized protein n=1 Tax=Nelumbo nucifera TaxID=4432 RepID=A0A822XN65_NELNU|nr:TPA_asm: hypothetical protein HUJ06_022606 [Nelumbo nucifera]
MDGENGRRRSKGGRVQVARSGGKGKMKKHKLVSREGQIRT